MKGSHPRAADRCPFVIKVRLPLSCNWECYVKFSSKCEINHTLYCWDIFMDSAMLTNSGFN